MPQLSVSTHRDSAPMPVRCTIISAPQPRASTLRRQRLNDLQGDRRQRILTQWLHEVQVRRGHLDIPAVSLTFALQTDDPDEDSTVAEDLARSKSAPATQSRCMPAAPESPRPDVSASGRRDSGDVAAHRQATESILTMRSPARSPSSDSSYSVDTPASPTEASLPSRIWFTMHDDMYPESGKATLHYLDGEPIWGEHGPADSRWPTGVVLETQSASWGGDGDVLIAC
ncbi:hypothetical protein FA95DRAFT_1400212 [Auriscalpium vulgare]|uniref:Uncharacterized protein n=1 Tax=Auriscalpium vulgare TaxID=40419 RepID=A0ACB8RRB6_9AGAM|nr:hypothetical protein FA95DRAFT_1400212 [Auriscalpium vulgare]